MFIHNQRKPIIKPSRALCVRIETTSANLQSLISQVIHETHRSFASMFKTMQIIYRSNDGPRLNFLKSHSSRDLTKTQFTDCCLSIVLWTINKKLQNEGGKRFVHCWHWNIYAKIIINYYYVQTYANDWKWSAESETKN